MAKPMIPFDTIHLPGADPFRAEVVYVSGPEREPLTGTRGTAWKAPGYRDDQSPEAGLMLFCPDSPNGGTARVWYMSPAALKKEVDKPA